MNHTFLARYWKISKTKHRKKKSWKIMSDFIYVKPYILGKLICFISVNIHMAWYKHNSFQRSNLKIPDSNLYIEWALKLTIKWDSALFVKFLVLFVKNALICYGPHNVTPS